MVSVTFIMLFLISCSYVSKDNIKLLGSECSSTGIGTILPKNRNGYYSYDSFEDFDNIFHSVDREGYYTEKASILGSKEQLIIIFKYDETTYKKVKEYSVSNMRYISNNPVYSYCNYEFYDTLWHEYRDSLKFSQHFAYNDEKRVLVFFGSYYSGIYKENAKLKETDFEKYLSLFSDYYDFTK